MKIIFTFYRTSTYLVFTALISCLISCSSVKPYQLVKTSSEKIILGTINKTVLKENTNWFEPNYNAYLPDSNSILELKKQVNTMQVFVVAGSWCSDTQRELPKFYKIADAIGLKKEQMEVILLDENKNLSWFNVKVFQIYSVPTFIFMKNGKELGRIVEMATQPFEKEWLTFYSE